MKFLEKYMQPRTTTDSVTVRFPPSLLARARIVSKKTGVSLNTVLVAAIENSLDFEDQSQERRKVRKTG